MNVDSMILLESKSRCEDIQYLTVSGDFEPSFIGHYSLVKLLDGASFICKIKKLSSLSNKFCIIDKRVELNDSECINSNSPNRCKSLSIKDIELIPKINTVKSLTICIVFKDPWERTKWLNKELFLECLLRNVLNIFVICENSSIYLDNLIRFNLLGIHLIKILTIGTKGFGRVINTCKIKIHSYISLNTFTQLHVNRPKYVTFHDEAQDDIKTILLERRRLASLSLLGDKEIPILLQQILLIGPGGCGKNSLLNNICYENKVVILPLDVSEISSLEYEERKLYFTNKLKLAFALSNETESRLCMIVIKQIENLMSKSEKSLGIIINFLEDIAQIPNIIVAATTDSPQSIHSSLRTSSKFGIEVYLNIPSENEKVFMIKYLFAEFQLNDDSCLVLARSTPGFVVSDLVLIFRKCFKDISCLNNPKESEKLNIIKSCVKSIQPSSIRGVIGLVMPSEVYNINKIGGLQDIKKKLIQTVVWPLSYVESFKRMNIPSPCGVLLYGPPGCAKTSLVRAVASSCKTTFLTLSAADLYSPFVGDAEKIIKELFQRARASSPAILFVDEIDALVGSRTFREKGVQERVLSSFLTEIDGIGYNKDSGHSLNEKYTPLIIVIAASNRPQMVDSALLRPGRLDKLIYVPPPDIEERLDILSRITENIIINKDVSLRSIAERTENYSGADLVNLCREAGLNAIATDGVRVDNISEEHFNHALQNLKSSLTSDQISWYQQFTFR